MLVLSSLWMAWLASWLLASVWSATTITQQSAGARISQSVPIWIGAFLLLGRPRGLGGPVFPQTSFIGWLAVAVATLGFALTWWARIHLGKFWSAAVTLKAGHTLVRSGPYAMTRHPIYTGVLLAIAGSALARDSLAALVGVAMITAGLVLKLRQEEDFLSARFGAAYDAYKAHVPALIPRPWRRRAPA